MSVSSGCSDMPSLDSLPPYPHFVRIHSLASSETDPPRLGSVHSSNSDTSVWTWGSRTSVPADDLSDLDNETCTSCRTFGATVHSDLEASAGTAWARRAHSWPPCTFSRRVTIRQGEVSASPPSGTVSSIQGSTANRTSGEASGLQGAFAVEDRSRSY